MIRQRQLRRRSSTHSPNLLALLKPAARYREHSSKIELVASLHVYDFDRWHLHQTDAQLGASPATMDNCKVLQIAWPCAGSVCRDV
jgi:hypothetical protein